MLSDYQLRKNIVSYMKKAGKPVTYEEIADNSGLKKDFWIISSVLNQLKLFGIIEEQKDFAGKRKYILKEVK